MGGTGVIRNDLTLDVRVFAVSGHRLDGWFAMRRSQAELCKTPPGGVQSPRTGCISRVLWRW